MTDAPELLPCPFCGGKPEGPIDATKVLGVWRIIHRGCVIPNFSVDRSQKESAITAWNTRAPDPRVAALVEASEALRIDMVERAKLRIDRIHGEQYRIVNAGCTAWGDFCTALAPFKGGVNGRQTP